MVYGGVRANQPDRSVYGGVRNMGTTIPGIADLAMLLVNRGGEMVDIIGELSGTVQPGATTSLDLLFPEYSQHTVIKTATDIYSIFSRDVNGWLTRRVLNFVIGGGVLGIKPDLCIGKLLHTIDQSAATFTGTWSNSTNAEAYGGTYRQSSTAGDYAEWVTPEGTTEIGFRGCLVENSGFAKVLVDGDAEKANCLRTAKEFVDLGLLGSTALVVNGGTLNPTDRLINQYSVNTYYDYGDMIAQGLEPGAHTVRFIVTGYKQSAATGTRLWISGLAYNDGDIAVAETSFFSASRIQDFRSGSVSEFAYQVTISTTTEWVGNGHGNETISSVVFTLDGETITPALNTPVSGASVTVAKNSVLRHSQSVPDIANAVCNYQFSSDFKVSHSQSWLVTCSISADSYNAMYPVIERLRIGSGQGFSQNYLANAGTGTYGNAQTSSLYMWSSNEVVRVKRSVDTPSGFIEDRSGNTLNKLYMRLSSSVTNIVSGSTTSGEAIYQASYIYDGVLMTIVSGSGPSDWVVKFPELPWLMGILGLDTIFYDASGNAHEISWATLMALEGPATFGTEERNVFAIYDPAPTGNNLLRANKYFNVD